MFEFQWLLKENNAHFQGFIDILWLLLALPIDPK